MHLRAVLWCVCVLAQSCLTLCHPVDCSPSVRHLEFSRREYWSGLPFPCPGDLPNPGIEPPSPALAGGFFTISAMWDLIFRYHIYTYMYMHIYLYIYVCWVLVASRRLWHLDSVIVVHGLSCSVACRILVSRPGIEPTSPALQGRFLTTGSPGSPLPLFSLGRKD